MPHPAQPVNGYGPNPPQHHASPAYGAAATNGGGRPLLDADDPVTIRRRDALDAPVKIPMKGLDWGVFLVVLTLAAIVASFYLTVRNMLPHSSADAAPEGPTVQRRYEPPSWWHDSIGPSTRPSPKAPPTPALHPGLHAPVLLHPGLHAPLLLRLRPH